MASVFTRIRRRLDAMPMWAVLALDAGIVAVFLFDVRIPDPFKFTDEFVLGGAALGTGIYLWRRFFGAPGKISAAARREVAEIRILFDESRLAAQSIPGAGGDVVRLGTLLEKLPAIEARLEQTEIVLQSPQYDVAAAQAEIDHISKSVAETPPGHARENLVNALAEATRHAGNIRGIQATRDDLSSALERVYQLVRRIHSQIVGLGLSQGTERDVSGSVDELAKTLDEYERDQASLARAEKIADAEIAEAERKARPVGRPDSN